MTIDSDNFVLKEMATSSKRPKFFHEISDDFKKDEKTFDHLPDEVQLKIAKFLEMKDLIRFAHVSKNLHAWSHRWNLSADESLKVANGGTK